MMKKKMNSDGKFEEVKESMVFRDFPNAKTINMSDAKIDCHTFKLDMAIMQKNVSYNEKRPILEPQEHCHWYHTRDSYGRDMKGCNSVGGHFHNITVFQNADGSLGAECSQPVRNNFSNELMDSDKHIHKCTYNKSELVEMRKTSATAQAMISAYLKEPELPLGNK
jgi:hypothetical protein